MQAAARIREGISKALNAVSMDGAEGSMSDAIRWLEDAAPQAGGYLEEPVRPWGAHCRKWLMHSGELKMR